MWLNNLGFVAVGVISTILVQSYWRKYQILKAIKSVEKISKHDGFKLKPGWAHNPALKYPENYPCFCGSGQKFKKCCSNSLPLYVKSASIKKIEAEVNECLRFVETNMGKLKNENDKT